MRYWEGGGRVRGISLRSSMRGDRYIFFSISDIFLM